MNLASTSDVKSSANRLRNTFKASCNLRGHILAGPVTSRSLDLSLCCLLVLTLKLVLHLHQGAPPKSSAPVLLFTERLEPSSAT